MLYLIATPLGNLADITYRSIEVLMQSDEILCEDTRRSKVLLSHYGICKPLIAFHQHNEQRLMQGILEKLQNGMTLSLISDAGTPAIHDPGASLIRACHKQNISVSALPGPCALITAITFSGLSDYPFQFQGFLSKKNGERKKQLVSSLTFDGITIFYETPHQINKTLSTLVELAPQRKVFIARELTKIHEELLSGIPSELLDIKYRGEIVLLVQGQPSHEPALTCTPTEALNALEEFGLTHKDATKYLSSITNLKKNELY